MDLTREQLVDVGLDALAAAPGGPGPERARVLAAAGARRRPSRHPGWTDTPEDGVTSLDAFIRTAAELGHLLDALRPSDLTLATRAQGRSVADLVRHLVGVERYVLGQLGRGPAFHAPRREDHYTASEAAAADLAGAGPAELARAWWLEVMQLIGACGELGPDRTVAYHHLSGSIRGLLVVRTFELWTHDEDIRVATGQPPNELDAPRLALMVGKLMELLPVGMAMQATSRPGRAATIRLRGPNGWVSYAVPLEPGGLAGPPDVVISTGALDICRLAANRLPLDQLDAVVEGDRSLLEPVLVGATAFSMD